MNHDTGPPTHWTCLQCGERSPNDFNVCWSCGTSREGVPDPAFRAADEVPEDVPAPSRPSAELAGVRRSVSIGLVMLGTMIFLADASRRQSNMLSVAVWLGLWGLAALLWPKRSAEEP